MPSTPTIATLFNLKGKSAVVLGALGTFGGLSSRLLASAGANVLMIDGDAGKLASAAEAIQAEAKVKVATHAALPANAKSMGAAMDVAVKSHGGVDILIAASGSNIARPTVDMTEAEWDSVMDTNVRVSWLAAQAAGRVMIKQGRGGKIVLMSSTRGKLGLAAGYSAYVPAKHAVEGLVKTLGCEWGPHKINVNGIGPTVTRSALSAWMFSNEDPGRSTRLGMLARIPLGRLGEPEDLAGVFLFLVSPASDFCTGQVLYIDGGYTAG